MTSNTNPNGRSQFVRVPGGVVRVADPFTVLERQMVRLFDDFKDPAQAKGMRIGATDVTEDAKGYTISIEVPGCEEKDIKLSTSGGTLAISGEKKKPEVPEGTKQHVAGRAFASFEDAFAIPEDADADKITAALKNGVLTITLPRKAEIKPAERTIAIQS
ncbi:Hsp20/alpha crystallin family protein [Acetobacter estunensis]|uniref:Hsp20/alpha crystallin family protein n=1 Tax=Acetobacter estunensis TaxID=104097 RepID=UPI0020C3CE6D|nr:Hsp20/alpha crystallin family protein [Acetobacter estunensis]